MRHIGKYLVHGEITKPDGTPIPDDEPLILFRAQDKLVTLLLEQYKQLCQAAGSPKEQLDLLEQRVNEIRTWQANNPDKLKAPD